MICHRWVLNENCPWLPAESISGNEIAMYDGVCEDDIGGSFCVVARSQACVDYLNAPNAFMYVMRTEESARQAGMTPYLPGSKS
jgi:hypothetical protein